VAIVSTRPHALNEDIALTPLQLKREVIPVTLGLGTEDAARCPSGMMACPVTTMTLLEAANASSGVDFDW
jgi:hypothetical protein